MSQKIRFLFQFLPFLNTSKETVEYLMHHLACHQLSKMKIQTGGLRIYFCDPPPLFPGIFRIVTLP